MRHLVPWISSFVEYALLMRIPLLTGALLFFFPWLARLRSTCALLLGLFDVTPVSTAAVTLAAMSVAAMVADNSRVIYLNSFHRGIGGLSAAPLPVPTYLWFILILLLSLPVIVWTIWFSNSQNPGNLARRIGYAVGTICLQLAAQVGLVHLVRWLVGKLALPSQFPDLPAGYNPLNDHLAAAAGFALALLVYSYLGVYGANRLGKKSTVPALCSALMVMMLACSVLSAFSFFLDLWHVPVLLILAIWGVITTRSKHSDHYYQLVPRPAGAALAPTPLETLRATKLSQQGRVIVVAANGGGIQAAAWAAQVLEGLGEESPGFAQSLRLISSVSGGSLGSVCYTYKRANPAASGAFDAASKSSLDEVSWGLSWPDFLNAIFPWIVRDLSGRGSALEEAWIANTRCDEVQPRTLGRPLSEWNSKVRDGDLPAVIMNATLVETGQRFLLGTTRFTGLENGRARVDGSSLHGSDWDLAAVTAARLSASFPFVTPAARSTAEGLQPHVVDGGYYDNYGMSTLVEWLDEALVEDQETASPAVKSVLVIQIHGAPVDSEGTLKGAKLNQRGWFFQILAPILTLNSVRGAGQIAHNDLELRQLQQRWRAVVPIHSVTLEFPKEDAPLSWHLTQLQRQAVISEWVNCTKVQRGRQQVAKFLSGSDNFDCPCPTCQEHPLLSSTGSLTAA